MANEIIYNPLLKRGLQELGDTAAQEAEIEDLRQKKVTKFFAFTDTLEPGEIAQYQGDDDSDNGLVNGYFYKKTGVSVVIAPPINEYQFTNDFPLNQPFVLGDYNFVFGNYYQVKNYNIQSSIISAIQTHTYQNKYVALESIAVNTKVFNRPLNRFEVVITIDNVNYIATTDQGSQIDISGVSSSSFTDLIEVGNADGTESFIFLSKQYGFYTLLVHWDFENNTIIDWFPFQCLYDTRNTPYNYNTEQFQQVNCQPAETVSDTVTEDDPNPVSGGGVFNAIKDALPSKDKWQVVETLTNNSSSVVTLPFSVPADGFYLLMIGGTNGGNNCVARLLTPNNPPYGSTLPIASTVMYDGYGAVTLCYLFSGSVYNFQLTEVTETTTAKIIRLS